MSKNEDNAQELQDNATAQQFLDQPLYVQFLEQNEFFTAEISNGLQEMFTSYFKHRPVSEGNLFDQDVINAYRYLTSVTQNQHNLQPLKKVA